MAAGYERAKDAADSLGVKPGTYRTWEKSPADGGREPPLTEIQRMARKYKVSWVWLATGEGAPDIDPITNERIQAVTKKAAEVDESQKDQAWAAVMAVLESFKRKAG